MAPSASWSPTATYDTLRLQRAVDLDTDGSILDFDTVYDHDAGSLYITGSGPESGIGFSMGMCSGYDGAKIGQATSWPEGTPDAPFAICGPDGTTDDSLMAYEIELDSIPSSLFPASTAARK